jgi:hypothetical protein
MKYVFFLSLLYKHFKKPCSFRIYIDDVMVDEVVLDKDINPINNFKKKYAKEYDGWIYRNLCRRPMAEKIWIYHIDLKDSNKNIFLDFNVNDSDYTNGFMSRSALVNITCAGLIKESTFNRSKDFFVDYAKKIKKIFFHIEKHRLAHVPEHHPILDKWKFPIHQFNYPSVWMFLAQNKNSTTMEEKVLTNHWWSGNFLVKIKMIKKHKNMILQDCHRPVKGVVNFDPYIIWLKHLQEVINIYNEDQ